MKLRFPPTRYRVVRDAWLGYEAQFRPWWSLLMKLRFPPTRYRVVRDAWLGYEAQFRPWWSLFWMPCNRDGGGVKSNSNHTIESARQLCANHARHRRSPVGQVVARFSARELEAQADD